MSLSTLVGDPIKPKELLMKILEISIQRIAGLAATVMFVLSVGATDFAQKPPDAGQPVDTNARRVDRARQVSESTLRSAEMDAALASERQSLVDAAIHHMKEDFARIQVLRNDIARDLVARKPLNYNLILEQTAEINKRASRLNVYLSAKSSEVKEPGNSANSPNDEMIPALVKLCKLVDSFTENPTLKNAATVDAKDIEKAKENKAQADRDLLAIIKLSETIKKKAESLKKP
jgi:hypothetical protein